MFIKLTMLEGDFIYRQNVNNIDVYAECPGGVRVWAIQTGHNRGAYCDVTETPEQIDALIAEALRPTPGAQSSIFPTPADIVAGQVRVAAYLVERADAERLDP